MGSSLILAEVEVFGARKPLVPLVLGGDEVPLPHALCSRVAVIVGRDSYAARADTPSEEWTGAVKGVRQALWTSPPPAAEALPRFSIAARRALAYAGAMVSDAGDEAHLRTAALLGALLTSAQGGMTPTTGDVVRLVLDHQKTARTAEHMLDAAARAGGLSQLGEERPQAIDAEAFATSRVGGPRAGRRRDATRTEAESVHLRHVLATGVHQSVPAAALAELGVTLDDIRETWRASIERTWPDE